MTTITTKRWLLVALAVFGLALAATAVSADGTDTTTDDPRPFDGTDTPPYNGTGEEWGHWMETRMTEHVADGNDTAHGAGYGVQGEDTHRGGHGMAGRGHGC